MSSRPKQAIGAWWRVTLHTAWSVATERSRPRRGNSPSVVVLSIDNGLEGMHTLTRTPSSVGRAIYRNPGAYGHQIDKFGRRVDFLNDGKVRSFGPEGVVVALFGHDRQKELQGTGPITKQAFMRRIKRQSWLYTVRDFGECDVHLG